MKLNTTDFRRKLQHSLLLALLGFPLTWLMLQTTGAAVLPWVYFFPAAYVLLSWACILTPGKRRILAGFAGALMLAGLSAFAAKNAGFGVFLPAAMYIGLLFAALPIGGWPREKEMNLAWHVVTVLTHVLFQLLMDGSKRLGPDIYAAARTPLLVSFLLSALLIVLALNRASLESASMSRRKVPLIMKRQNFALTVGLLTLGILVAAIPAIGSALGTVWDFIMHLIALVGAFLSTLMPQKQSGGGGPAPMIDEDSINLGKVNEPSALAVFMEKVIGILAMIVLVIGLFFFLRMVAKKLIVLLKELWGQWSRYSAAASEDYEDEITDTRDESDVEREGLLTRLRRIVPEGEKGLNPNERIRNRYRRLKRKRDWNAASTARETLPENAAALYERVRYGGESLTDQDAEAFREGTKKV